MKGLKVGLLLGLSLLLGQAVAGEFSGLKASDYQQGTRSYLVYMQNNETGAIRMSEIWQRTTEITEQDGKPVVKITQHWHSA